MPPSGAYREGSSVAEGWRSYLRERRADDVRALADAPPDRRSLAVDLVDCHRHAPALLEALLADPDGALRAGEAVLRAWHDGLDGVRLRLTDDPQVVSLSALGARHVGELVTVEAAVEGVEPLALATAWAVYDCPRCEERVERRTRSPGRSAARCESCGGDGPLVLDHGASTFVDSQRVSLVPPVDERAEDAPRLVPAFLRGTLAGTVAPGDRLFVTGIARALPADDGRFDPALDALSVSAERSRPERAGVDAVLDSRWTHTGDEGDDRD